MHILLSPRIYPRTPPVRGGELFLFVFSAVLYQKGRTTFVYVYVCFSACFVFVFKIMILMIVPIFLCLRVSVLYFPL